MFVIDQVKIFTGDETIEKGFILVEDGRILKVESGDFTSDEDIPRYSHPGDSVIPGLIDGHIHALSGNVESIQQSLRFGVTTVCDMHNDPRDNAKLKQLSDANKSLYADFKCAGLGAIVEGGWPIPVIKLEFEHEPNGECIAEKIVSAIPKLRKPEDASPFIETQVKTNGASYIKMFHEVGDSLGMDLPEPPMDVQKAVVAAAHEQGVVAVGHAFSIAGTMALIKAGADGLTHVFLDKATPEQMDELVSIMQANRAHCNPTLALCASQTGEGQDLQQQFLQDAFAQKTLSNQYKASGKPLGFASAQKPRSSIENAYATTRALHKAGIPLVVGSDAAGKGFGTTYGLGVHMELWQLVHKIGLSPEKALQCATSVTADRFGFNDRGRVQPGKKADMVVISGDALEVLGKEVPGCLPVKCVWRDGTPNQGYLD